MAPQTLTTPPSHCSPPGQAAACAVRMRKPSHRAQVRLLRSRLSEGPGPHPAVPFRGPRPLVKPRSGKRRHSPWKLLELSRRILRQGPRLRFHGNPNPATSQSQGFPEKRQQKERIRSDLYFSQSMKLPISNQLSGPLKENQKSVCRGGSATGGSGKKRETKKIVWRLETERGSPLSMTLKGWPQDTD